ncbi:MAG: hypothetical protein CMC96_07970 [Flavobacteriales bacterium]|nr:hypothetical protein [Flavobacteriales bacterium]
MNILAQEADLIHNPDNREKTFTLKELVDNASGDTAKIIISDIQTPGGNYIDLFYNVSSRLYYRNMDVTKATLLESIFIDYNLKVFGTESGSQTADTYIADNTLGLSPRKDYSTATYFFNKDNDQLTARDLYDLDSAIISIDISGFNHLDTATLNAINFQLYVEMGRYSTKSYSGMDPAFVQSNSSNPNNELKKHEAVINWSEAPQPSTYELEIIHIPEENPNSSQTIDIDFSRGANRILTDKNFFPISMLYAPGYLVVRGRIKRPVINSNESALLNRFEYGAWSMNDSVNAYATSNLNVLVIGSDTSATLEKINWRYNSAYALGSKKRETIDYFDGSGKSRQSNTIVNDFHSQTGIALDSSLPFQTIIHNAESYYDYNGNEVISTLSAPVVRSTELAYQDSANLFDFSKLLKEHYDSLGYDIYPQLNKASKGAAYYFSDTNHLKNKDEKYKSLPDAKGYVYQRNAFLEDGSGRLKTVYNVGDSYAQDASKNTRYAYAKPTKTDLERLFGSNVGEVDAYKKNIRVDPNGVMNISYIDINDNVIATSIDGLPNASANMDSIPFNTSNFTENLLTAGAEKVDNRSGTFELSHSFFVPSGAIYQFEYGIDLASFQTCDSSLCYDCHYEVVFQIINDANELVLEAKDSIFRSDTCFSGNYALDELTYKSNSSDTLYNNRIYVQLEAQRQYSVIKRLKYLEYPIETYVESYKANENCSVLSLEYFQNLELDSTDFTTCETDYISGTDFEDPCFDIEQSLKEDFYYPDGAFVKGARLDDNVAIYIYDRLMEVSGCYELAQDISKSEFIFLLEDFNGSLYEPGVLTFEQYDNRMADLLIQYHPTYCQIELCRKYNNEESVRFTSILKRSNSIRHLHRNLKKGGYFIDSVNKDIYANPIADSLFYDDSLIVSTLLAEHDTAKYDSIIPGEFKTVIFNYDTLMLTLFTKGLYTNYNHSIYNFIDSSFYYEYAYLPENRNFSSNALEFIESSPHALLTYFSNYLGAQPTDTARNKSILEFAFMVAQSEEDKFLAFRDLYLAARSSMIEDVLNSVVCFESHAPIDTTGGASDSLIFVPIPDSTLYCYGADSSNYHYPWIDDTNAIRYRKYDHFVGYQGLKAELIEKQGLDGIADSLMNIFDSTLVGEEVYSLLLAEGCIDPLDSALFVNNIDSLLIVCEPFGYLDTLLGDSILLCSPYSINLSSVVSDFRTHFMDTSSTNPSPIFDCPNGSTLGLYHCADFLSAHNDFIINTTMQVPRVLSPGMLSITNTEQKQYKNWMNNRLGLNLSFYEFYKMAGSCVLEGDTTVFGDTVSWSDTGKVAAIRTAVVNHPDVYYNQLSDQERDSIINAGLSGTPYSFSSATDYLGLGEVNLENGQYNLYYLENGVAQLDKIKDTLIDLFYFIKQYDDLLPDIEDSAQMMQARELNITRYLSVESFTISRSLILDRAYQYSNGTIWLRLLNMSDSSYYNDYYFYYQPYNAVYYLSDLYINNTSPYWSYFDSISPIFDQEAMQYVRLHVGGIDGGELIAGSAKPFATAQKIGQVLLGDYQGRGEFPVKESCEDLKYSDALAKAQIKYQKYLEEQEGTFRKDYRRFCLNQDTTKAFTNQFLNMTYGSSERQFTLYYYDQAGNLVMTVPPDGIDTNFLVNYDGTVSDDIAAYRNGSGAPVLPNHTKRTTYKYNSDNNIIRQVTPNSDTTHFWYDKAGRLVFSQNAKQRSVNAFSYTIYDAQSRVIEVGEVTLNELSDLSWEDIHAISVLEIMGNEKVDLDSVIQSKVRNDVVRSFYDSTILDESSYGFEQKNLRSRLSTQAYYPVLDDTTTLAYRNWEFATHYSYDPTGNVKTLVNDFYQQGNMNRNFDRFKRIDYDYDVISGNVLQVYYQLGLKDAFYHRYEYDAENRITKVETSRDGIIWDEDANYEYYLHGPLARTEIGEHNVQGIDYAYTLQGWVKSVNAGHKNADMGMDHEKDNVFASDAFGFSIQYNQNDYEPIGSNNDFLIQHSGHSDLYNGNIAAISLHNQEMTYGRQYIYDQLNRLTEMNEYNVDEASKSWDGVMMNGNTSTYEYDKNGNLTELTRFDGEKERFMDVMNYHYINSTDKLSYVTDTVSAEAFGNDIDNQSMSNYSYDEIGNLSADIAEGICKIRWFPNGKVKRIVRTNPTRQKADLAFEYDGMGNRVKKTVSFIEDGRSYLRTTYYVRDAQGNVLTTYEERNCQLFAGDDTLGDYYYQFSESYGYYTLNAIEQIGEDAFFYFLLNQFSKKDELKNEAVAYLDMVPNIRDTIIHYMDVSQYIGLYPGAALRIFDEDPQYWADIFYDPSSGSSFIMAVNNKHEVYIRYLIENNDIQNFYSSYNNNFTSYYSLSDQGENAIYFYEAYRDIIAELYAMGDLTMIQNLLDISAGEFDIMEAAIHDSGFLIDQLGQLMEQLNSRLENNDPNGVADLIRKIKALLILGNMDGSVLEEVMQLIDLNHFYNAYSWLNQNDLDALNSLMFLIHGAHAYHDVESQIDIGQLNPFEPLSYTLDFTYDTNGDFLKYFIHLDYASWGIINPMLNYLETLNLNDISLYQSSPGNYYPYVISALRANISDFINIIQDDSYSKEALHSSENLVNLIHYFEEYHINKSVKQHYYYDTLNTALSGVSHLSPYAYAKELEGALDVIFPGLAGCPSDSLYLLASSYNIYGSSRLGTMNAKSKREDDDNIYSRKLGGKQYELSDHLGNVVATFSDKKLHPQELLPPGSHAVDTTIGFQPEVTGRYDYYPFGMEIMSRSGNFTNIDYTTDVTELLYSGLLKDCDAYDMDLEEDICETNTNIYGQEYVESYVIKQRDNKDFKLLIDIPLSYTVQNIDPDGNYRIEIEMNGTMSRPITAKLDFIDGVVSSPSAGSDATVDEIIKADDKVITFDLKGDEINSIQRRGELEVFLLVKESPYARHSLVLTLSNIKITQTFENTTVPLAMREENAYTYGFNGQERTDEVSGSGNHYTAPFWEYDPRAVHRWNLDPKPNTSFSPYAIMQGNPIMYSDPLGDSVKNKYQAGAKYEGLKEELSSKVDNAQTKSEKRAARKEYRANKGNFRLYDKYQKVNKQIEGFKSKNESEFDILNNLTFNGEEIDIIVGLKSGFSGNKGQYGETLISYPEEDIIKVEDFKTGGQYDLPTTISGNEIHIGLYRLGLNVSTMANEFGDALFSVKNPRSSYRDRELPYHQRGSTNFSFDYQDYIMKGGSRPNPLKY